MKSEVRYCCSNTRIPNCGRTPSCGSAVVNPTGWGYLRVDPRGRRSSPSRHLPQCYQLRALTLVQSLITVFSASGRQPPFGGNGSQRCRRREPFFGNPPQWCLRGTDPRRAYNIGSSATFPIISAPMPGSGTPLVTNRGKGTVRKLVLGS